jgi:uncharacterized damage-inducible protein DinB
VPDAASASPTLAALRVRITRVFPAQIRASVESVTDEQLWWRPNETSNSIGNLVLHISGSLNLYLNRNIGGFSYERDREAEFSSRGPMNRRKLMAIFDEMVANAERTLDKLTPEKLGGPSTDPARNSYLVDDLISITTHLANHTGQIVWIAKMLHEGALNEVWMRAHKREGAWKR